MQNSESLSRRSFLQAAVTAPIIHGHGRIAPPILLPGIKIVRQDGVSSTLLQLVKGRATALQLMFTSCTTTCPIEAAIFERVQKMLPGMAKRGLQLLSLSNDPQNDTPKALAAWRRRFHAGPNWIAAAPAVSDLAKLNEIFGKGSDSADHSTQVQMVDREGRLVWRTFELPRPEEIAEILQKM
jgi:protein SCO1/2